jgi:hypothetical protein
MDALRELTPSKQKGGTPWSELDSDPANGICAHRRSCRRSAIAAAEQFCYDDGLRIPLIIRWAKSFPAPSGFNVGSVDDRLVEAIDLAPTFLDIAGAKKPEKMQGRILFGERAGKPLEYAFGARDRCDETVFPNRSGRPLSLHQELHAGETVLRAERLQGQAVPGLESDPATGQGRQADRRPSTWPRRCRARSYTI